MLEIAVIKCPHCGDTRDYQNKGAKIRYTYVCERCRLMYEVHADGAKVTTRKVEKK